MPFILGKHKRKIRESKSDKDIPRTAKIFYTMLQNSTLASSISRDILNPVTYNPMKKQHGSCLSWTIGNLEILRLWLASFSIFDTGQEEKEGCKARARVE